ncbi:MAG: hypothetical protein PHV74_15400 [Dehalococcoidia bacterium]|nr:hypothetical protein [Dehalococcoidia bacterium]
MTELEEIREAGGKWLYALWRRNSDNPPPFWDRDYWKGQYDKLLSEVQTPTLRLAVVEKQGKLPENPYYAVGLRKAVYTEAQHDMIEDHWVREAEE